ncbi:MAG: alpha/beta hydrolase, partial [Phycisphaerae bacterium]|nr:alpha/beta hydrolase [Phycisphaerae bacterium]
MRIVLVIVLLCGLLVPLAGAEMKNVQFVVIVPDYNQDQPERIFLSSAADGWKEQGRPLKRVAPGVYSATFEFPAGLLLEYKFTRAGSWATVEKSPDGQEIPNRTFKIGKRPDEQVVVNHVARWAGHPASKRRRVQLGPSADEPAPTRESTLTGEIRSHQAFRSPQLKNERTIMVYLPPGYKDHPEQRYPVLYLHDGNNLFDAKTSFTGIEWQVDETAERLIKAGLIRELIIVGIYNNADRMDEYTPFHDAGRNAGGDGEAYLAFIVDTLKPFIDKTYRTRTGRAHTGIAGSSLGGLISLYAVHRYPHVFSRAGVISPALWWADRAVIEYVRQNKPEQPLKIWIDTGLEEGPKREPAGVSQYAADCRELVKILAARGCRPDLDYHYEEVADGRHHESDWAGRFDRVLLFLFGKERPLRCLWEGEAPAEPRRPRLGRSLALPRAPPARQEP